MKKRFLTVLIIALLIFSSLNLALGAKVKCPECRGTGYVDCPDCDGIGTIGEEETAECSKCSGSGKIEPKIIENTMTASQGGGVTTVTATFTNQESDDVNGTVTATLNGHSATSPETTFPPDKEVTIELKIDYVGVYTQFTLLKDLDVTVDANEITCPNCDGEGTTTEGSDCLNCDGTGKVKCSECGGKGRVEESALSNGGNSNLTLIIAGVGVVTAVAAGGAGIFLLLKKRRVSEKSLRRLSTNELNEWVLKRLDGKPATSKDIAMGIDGFSRLNQPIAIRQTDSVGMTAIDSFAASLAKSRAQSGILVAFGFSDDAIRGKVRARTNYRLDIQMMTIRELIENRGQSGY